MAKTPAKPSETKNWSVLSPLRFDGVVYRPGDEVEMNERDAAPLVASGVLAAPAGKAGPAAPAA